VRRTGKVCRLAAVVFTASVLLVGCGISSNGEPTVQDSENAELTIGMVSDAQSLDPPNFVLAGDFVRTSLVYEGLVSLSSDGEVQPALATSWEQVSDTEWEFQLREGVTFHDGTPFNSEAVRISLERAAEQGQASTFLGMIEKVETPDEYTARIVLSEPNSSILNNLTVPVAGIISPRALETKGEDIQFEAVGTGPYTFVEWEPNTSMVFERNEDYWGAPAALKRVTFVPIPEAGTRYSALQSGEVDVIENPPPSELASIEASEELYSIIEPKARSVFLGFNLEEIPDVEVRRAIAYAIDSEAIVENVLEGVGRPATTSLTPPEYVSGNDPVGLGHDPDKARRLLEEAGVEDLELELVLPTERYLKDQEIAEVIQDQLAEIGVTVRLNVQEPGTWFQSLLDHETQLYWLGWGLSSGDPAEMLRRVFHSEELNNMSQYDNEEVDELLDRLRELEVGSAQRNQVIQQIEQIVVEDDVVVVPVYQMSNFYAARSGVQGVHTTPTELIDLSEVTVAE